MEVLRRLLIIMGIFGFQSPMILCNVCDTSGDIVFVIDGSDSISDGNWARQKNFVANLIDGFEISSDAIRVGIVVYSSNIGDTIRLLDGKNVLKAMTKSLDHPRRGTNTALGIQTARDMLKQQGRPDVPNIIVVITDGRSKDPKDTTNQASLAKSQGITMVAIGVGSDIFIGELSRIASEPNLISTVQDFGKLSTQVDAIRDIICKSLETGTLQSPKAKT